MIKGTFKNRINRFCVKVSINGKDTECHLPNPGRLTELLKSGAEVNLQPATDKRRKTRYTLKSVQLKSFSVPIDSREPNMLLHKALTKNSILEFSGYDHIKTEVSIGKNRLDLLLSQNKEKCYIEVKSCTLVLKGTALFPDAPTTRGAKHIEILEELKVKGHRAAMVFIIQRPDAKRFKPNIETDPQFTHSLANAKKAGVEVYAYKVINGNTSRIRKIPVYL